MGNAWLLVPTQANSSRTLLRSPGGLCVAIVLTLLGGEGAVALATPSINPRPEAACLIVVHRSSDSQWPDANSLSALLQSSGVADVPAGEILGIAPELRAEKVRFQITPSMMPGELTLSVRVAFDLPQDDASNKTRAYLGAVIDRFRGALMELRDGRSAQYECEIQANTEALAATERERAKVQTMLREIDARVGPSNSMDLRNEPLRTQSEITMTVRYLENYRRQEDQAREDNVKAAIDEAWRQVATLLEQSVSDLHWLLAEGKVDSALVAKFEVRLEEARTHSVSGANAAQASGSLAPAGRMIGPLQTPKMASDRFEELGRLLERMKEFEKIDVRALAIEKEDFEMRERDLREKRIALTAKIEKLKLEVRNLSAISMDTVGK